MSDETNVTAELDKLIQTLDGAGAVETRSGNASEPVSPRDDAISAVLNGPGRKTAVRSLAQTPQIAAFREALLNGMIRVDTANQLLKLVNELVGQFVRTGG